MEPTPTQERKHGTGLWPTELCVVAAVGRDDLLSRIEEVRALLTDDLRLRDVAFTLSRDAHAGEARLAIVASSVDELEKKLAHAHARLSDPARSQLMDRSGIFYVDEPIGREGRLAFMFPGEGAQYTNMLRDLCLFFPEAREAFDEVDAACERAGDSFVPSRHIFPLGVNGAAADDRLLWEMEGAVEAVIGANTALMRLIGRLGIVPDAVVGHSSGEFMALETAGIWRLMDRDDRIRRIADGYALMKEMHQARCVAEGVLVAAGGAGRDVIDELIDAHDGHVVLAMINCPHQFVLCVSPSRVAAVTEALASRGAIVETLPFDRPYHTEWFTPALDGLRRFFRERPLHPPRVPIYSCVTARPFPDDPETIEEWCVGQWAMQVQFQATIEAMYEDGIRIFLEVGPRGNLSAFVDDILKGKPHAAIPTNRANRSGVTQLHHALGILIAHGIRPDLRPLHARRASRLLDWEGPADASAVPVSRRDTRFHSMLPQYRFDGLGPLRPRPAVEPESVAPAEALNPADQAMLDYLSTMDAFLEQQRGFAARFLGEEAAAAAPQAEPATPAIQPREAPFPLLGQIVEHVPGQSLLTVRTFHLDEETILRHHALCSPHVSVTDPDLIGLPVLPLTMSLEILCETACTLVPGHVVVRLEAIRATRWITLRHDQVTLRVEALMLTRGERPRVKLSIRIVEGVQETSVHRPVIVEANAELAAAYPPPPKAGPFELRNERPCRWEREDIYDKRLFHGPLFRALQRVDRWGENGIRARMEVLPRNGLIRSIEDPQFVIDPVVLDNVGSPLGLWGAYDPFPGTVYLPFRVQEISFYGPPLPPGSELDVRLQIKSVGEVSTVCDIEAIDDQGRVYIGVKEWEDRTADVTPRLHRVIVDTMNQYVSDPLALPADELIPTREVVARIISPIPPPLHETSEMALQAILAYAILSRPERDEWAILSGPEQKRIQWLLGRAAAKDSVRVHLLQTYGVRMAPADIRIRADEKGRPRAMGTWESVLRGPLSLSITHSDAVIAAAVCEGAHAHIGLRVDDRRRMEDAALARAFTKEERDLLLTVGDDAGEWAVRAWCAKRAAAAALGADKSEHARDLIATSIDHVTGHVDLALPGSWVSAADARRGHGISACTFRNGDSTFAISATV